MATAALRCSCHHGTYLLEHAEVTSIKCTAADDRLTLPGSERHRTVEVELQSTIVTIKCCQASKRRCTALSTTLTEVFANNVVGLSSHQYLIFMIETLKTENYYIINIRILKTDMSANATTIENIKFSTWTRGETYQARVGLQDKILRKRKIIRLLFLFHCF